jgi:predicted secreted protein
LLVVCSSAAFPQVGRCGPGDPAIVVTEKDAGRTVELRLGQELTAKLEVIRGSGFSWQIRKMDSEQLRALGPVADEPLDPPKPGAAALQVLSFRAVGEGTCDLELAYLRSFEPERPPARTYLLHVRVLPSQVGRDRTPPTRGEP